MDNSFTKRGSVYFIMGHYNNLLTWFLDCFFQKIILQYTIYASESALTSSLISEVWFPGSLSDSKVRVKKAHTAGFLCP